MSKIFRTENFDAERARRGSGQDGQKSKHQETASLESFLDVEERESRFAKKRTLFYLIHYILKQKKFVAVGVLLILIGTSVTLIEPRLFGYAIDEALLPKRWDLLTRISILFFVLECVRALALVGQGYLFEWLGQRVMQDLRMNLFSHLQALPVSLYDKTPVGRLVTRVTNDVASLADMFSAGFVTMFGNILTVIGILIWLLVLNLKLGLIAAIVFPFMLWASIYFSGKLRVTYRNARSRLSALNAFIAENILGMKVVHLFNRQKLHLSRFSRINEWYADAQINTVRTYAYFQPTITIASGVATALVLWFGGGMAIRGEIPLGILVAYFTYVFSLFNPIREITDKWNLFLSGIASAERIFSILDWKLEYPRERAFEPPVPIQNLQGHIVFENVWFAYEKEHWVLKDFSFEIKPGMKVGIVGQTGAGKTTIISLLLRFYEPQKGRILLDGKDLREYDKRSLRASIGIVQQDVFLFSGSIGENITLGSAMPESIQKPVQKMCEQVGLGSRLDWDAPALQERGSNLSMGERQILAFARVLAASPPVWILDEATANVDSTSEEKLVHALEAGAVGRTAILIAHRLSTVRSADVILVMHKGALAEQGKHAELMRKNGLYARLYRYQESAAQASG